MAIDVDEELKDRRDYRQALIYRQECTEAKIKAVEAQISKLNEHKNHKLKLGGVEI